MTGKANSIEVPLNIFSLISVSWNFFVVYSARLGAVGGQSWVHVKKYLFVLRAMRRV